MAAIIWLYLLLIKHMQTWLICLALIGLGGCGTLVNDAFVPMYLSFSDGSEGTCQVTNKRMNTKADIPGSLLVRRSDDNLQLDCETEDGRESVASIQSTVGTELMASFLFFDYGITDSITDKHRHYPPSFVIPVNKQVESQK